ncbi:DEA(D/H)-box RNA helicase family protein [Tanacetum coccineum]
MQKQTIRKRKSQIALAAEDALETADLREFNPPTRDSLSCWNLDSIEASAHQRRGRAGRVQPGECYHLYSKSVYDSFVEYQLSELLRTPLQSLCLQIKSLQLGSISEFLSRALQPPEPLSVQNAIEYLKIIGALDDNENLTVVGCKLSVLPVEPKLAAKDQFFGRDNSDHLVLLRAYDGWKAAERQQLGHEYCWRNFLSSQTLRAIDSLKKQFSYLLRDNEPTTPYPWLVFNEKVKVNSVFLRDSTAVFDSVVLIFRGSVSRGVLDGHLKMLGGYLEFFMKPGLAGTYLALKRELDELIQMKLLDPKIDIGNDNELLEANLRKSFS